MWAFHFDNISLIFIREHLLGIRDVGFTHALYEINTGDRMWVHWRQSETNSTTPHSMLIKRVCQLDDQPSSEQVVSYVKKSSFYRSYDVPTLLTSYWRRKDTYPVGMQRRFNVETTSLQRQNNIPTLKQRLRDVICLLGSLEALL